MKRRVVSTLTKYHAQKSSVNLLTISINSMDLSHCGKQITKFGLAFYIHISINKKQSNKAS